jgi:hypothetical protein
MKRTITTIFAVLLSLTAMSVAAAAQTDRTLTLRVGDQKKVTDEKLKIRFAEVVEDSRCPKGANCVWAGNAKMKITYRVGNGAEESVEINTSTGRTGFRAGNYAFTFVSLTEKPAQGRGAGVRPRLVLSYRRISR